MALVFYSVLNDLIGFAIAALIACRLIVTNASVTADKPAIKNTSQPISILYAKSCSHLLIIYQANGDAITIAMATSFKKSFDNSKMIFGIDATNTLRTPISLVRFTAASAARPSKPRQARKIEMPPANPMILLQRTSDL